jgi:hypothetical protein
MLLLTLLLFYGFWQARAHPETPERNQREEVFFAVGIGVSF